MEQDKIVTEFQELLVQIRDLGDILARPERLLTVIRAELEDIRAKYADKRRTEIIQDHSDLTIEDLIEQQDVVVTLSHGGYAKAQPVTAYQAQRRGGRGKAATAMKEEDFVDKLFVANTHDTLLCFSTTGKLYWLKVYQLPQASRGSRGKPIVNLLPLQEGERITAVVPIHEFEENKFVFMVTAQGTVKKTSLDAFSRPRQAGIIAIELEAGDRLVGVDITDGHRQIILCSSGGKAIRFDENDVRPMGRTAANVRGIRLPVSESDLADDRRRAGHGADGLAERLRQTHAGRGLPDPRSRWPGRHRPADQRAQRPDGRRAAREAGRRDHADQLRRHAGAHADRGNLHPGPQHAGRAPDPTRRRRSPRRYGRIVADGADGAEGEEGGEPPAE